MSAMAEPFIHLAGVKKVYRTRGQELKRFGFVFLIKFADSACLGRAGKLFEYCR